MDPGVVEPPAKAGRFSHVSLEDLASVVEHHHQQLHAASDYVRALEDRITQLESKWSWWDQAFQWLWETFGESIYAFSRNRRRRPFDDIDV